MKPSGIRIGEAGTITLQARRKQNFSGQARMWVWWVWLHNVLLCSMFT